MNYLLHGNHASAVWMHTLSRIFTEGHDVAPRGMKTLELSQHTVHMSMSRPVVLCPARKLSYTFLAAEALWILSGDDRVNTIAPYNPNISAFSDDGHRFAGAYGPRIMEQYDFVIDKLVEDRNTRQAVMTVWRPNPARSKDVPCTVAIMFSIRHDRLQCHVFMRSSDAWLGLPYDVFNFSMLAARIACSYNKVRPALLSAVSLGWLHLTMASSHLYERNFGEARDCLDEVEAPRGEELPESWVTAGDWELIEKSIVFCRDKAEGWPPQIWRIRP